MRKIILLTVMFMSLIITSCTSDADVSATDNVSTETVTTANAKVVFDIVANNECQTRSASVGSEWPDDTKAQAESVVDKIYTTPKSAGLSFFTDNYSVNLTNDKGGSITSWNGSTAISLTDVNNISVTLTENTFGAFPNFNTATGSIDLSKVDLDTSTPNKDDAVCEGDISIKNISTSTDGVVNVTIEVKLTYNSYLLVAPSSDWSVLSNVKGFTALKWKGSDGTSFFETKSSNDNKWFYFWGTGNEYVWGKGSLISYGFNLYSDDSNDIKVKNGYWYGLFAAWSSAGEGDDNPTDPNNPNDTDKTHTVGGENGVTPTANDINAGGAIR